MLYNTFIHWCNENIVMWPFLNLYMNLYLYLPDSRKRNHNLWVLCSRRKIKHWTWRSQGSQLTNYLNISIYIIIYITKKNFGLIHVYFLYTVFRAKCRALISKDGRFVTFSLTWRIYGIYVPMICNCIVYAICIYL